jgi:hypothetical protein
MKTSLILLVSLCIPLLAGPMAAEWPGEFYIATEKRALSLMPLALREILEEHSRDVFAGVQKAIDHHQFRSAEDEIRRIRNAVDHAAGRVRSRRPLAEFAFAMGEICGLICENSSPHVMDPDGCGGADKRKKFFRYTREKLPKFVPAFRDDRQRRLTVENLGSRIEGMLQKTERACAKLAAGSIDNSHDWDDRSVQFGVASLAHSDAILEVAAFWLLAWESAGGDMRDAPAWWHKEPE